MNWFIILVRASITLTFLLLAAGGPYALILLRRFMVKYGVAHKVLEARIEAIERRLQMIEHEEPHD